MLWSGYVRNGCLMRDRRVGGILRIYCAMNIHKAQGSEYEYVFLDIDDARVFSIRAIHECARAPSLYEVVRVCF